MKELSQTAHQASCLTKFVQPLRETGDDYQSLLDLVGEASLVLLGESTHGSHEFYRERAEITKQLIVHKGFQAIAIEGDWPDAHRIHRYIRGLGDDTTAMDALSGFRRFPSWMWANADMLDFIGWLRGYNETLGALSQSIGFYGLDLYSMFSSARAVIAYLDNVDPEAAQRARIRLSCLDPSSGDSQKYAYAVGMGLQKSCEDAVVNQLLELLKNAVRYRKLHEADAASDDYFDAVQNSRLVKNAEHYYRMMVYEDVSSWNLRDQHMTDTVNCIRLHLLRQGQLPKLVVWAHNSHVGDARATDMSRRGEYNLGQLTKQLYGAEVCAIGFTTYEGSVTAASNWDGVAEHKRVRAAIEESYEHLFHRLGIPRFFLGLEKGKESTDLLRRPLLQRAIGVLYLPKTERLSHYFRASLAEQFEGVIHIDRTRAVEPLEHQTHWERGAEPPETYPSGI